MAQRTYFQRLTQQKETPLSLNPAHTTAYSVILRTSSGCRYSPASHPGGCFPNAASTNRKFTDSVRFIFKHFTVARPVGVRPSISVRVSSQAKCSCQFCVGGLTIGTIFRVNGSKAASFVCLCALQAGHENARFSGSSLPCLLRDWMCSTEKGAVEYPC